MRSAQAHRRVPVDMVRCIAIASAVGACGGGSSAGGAGSSATSTDSSDGATRTSGTSEGTSDAGSGTATTGATTTMTTAAGSTVTSASGATCTAGGTGACRPVAVVLGYWPPTNEMLRQWSTNPAQNPDGWNGEDWNGLGFDVYAFFPEFPPDGDPSNDDIGSEGSVGSPDSDLRVDYQDTSEDFWRIVDELEPVVLVTTSRGGNTGWEVEAVEGGHGDPDNADPSEDWASDGFGSDVRPTQDSVDPRSWDAISQYRLGETLPTQLPADAIVDAVSTLGLASVEIDVDGTSGNYLSGFLGLHGLFYNLGHPHNVAAGHIHVGRDVPNDDATEMIEATLVVVLEEAAGRRVTAAGTPFRERGPAKNVL